MTWQANRHNSQGAAGCRQAANPQATSERNTPPHLVKGVAICDEIIGGRVLDKRYITAINQAPQGAQVACEGVLILVAAAFVL